MSRSSAGATFLVLVLTALVPAAAQARTKSVYMGVPPKSQSTFQNTYNADVNAFFPKGITINAGDKVKFIPVGFHTVELPAKGSQPTALFGPDGNKIAGDNDAAGQPFWFNGQDEQFFSQPIIQSNNFGKTLKYTGKQRVETGLPLADKPAPMTVKFTKAGTFTYYCNVHPGMKAKVHVRSRHAKRVPASADRRALRNQVNAAVKVAKDLNTSKPADGTVQVGAGGKGGVEVYRFFPDATTVPVGTTLRFAMSTGSFDIHTATTGPGNPETEPASYLGAMAASLTSPKVDQAAVYPSELPGGATATLTPALHGNGFWNTGIMAAKSAPLPSAGTVTFGQAGTYTFYCLIHPFMKATVTVS